MTSSSDKQSLKSFRRHMDADYFKPDSSRSFAYLIRDVMAILCLSVAIHYALQGQYYVFALLLSIINGNFFFALFVVGHDCGHGSFSKSKKINNLVGFIAHQFLLTPYWAWKKSHDKHHRFSGNINKDESIVPFSQTEAQTALGVRTDERHTLSLIHI